MLEKLPLWEAAKREMEEYQFAVEAEIQPKWNVPRKIAINADVSSRFGDGKQSKPMSLESYVDAASSVIEAGACGVHIDFSWITDDKGRRADLNGKVKVRVSGPTTFDPQRQAQMFLAELETKPDVLIVVNVAPPLFTQPALEAQSRGAHVVWISVPPMPEVKDPLFVGSDAFGMGRTAGAIIVSALENSHNKPAADITGDVVTGICVPGLVVLENRLVGEISYLKSKMPKINVLPSFNSASDRERSYALWDQAIRKTPNALTYLDVCEEGEENIPKILENDKIKVPLTSYESPEEIRDDLARGVITAIVSGNFFSQAYLAVYTSAQSILQGKPLPQGWLKVPHVIIDKNKIAAYQKAWETPETGLRAFYGEVVEATRDHLPSPLPSPDLFAHPAE